MTSGMRFWLACLVAGAAATPARADALAACRELLAVAAPGAALAAGDLSEAALRPLVRRAQAGDSGARDELFRRLLPLAALHVVKWAPKLEPADAADVLQDALLAMHVELGGYDPDRVPVRHWLASFVRNKAVDFLRRKAVRERRGATNAPDAVFERPEPGRTPERWLELESYLGELRTAAEAVLDDESPRDRAIFFDYVLGGKTLAAIGKERGLVEGSVSRIVARVRGKLEARLEPPPR